MLSAKQIIRTGIFTGSALLVLGFTINESPSLATSYEIARGGRLYDAWYKEKGIDAPAKRHPAYPEDGGYANKAASTWRCKECHGWDYLGAAGTYAQGSHFTGIKGTFGARTKNTEALIAILGNEQHGYDTHLDDDDLRHLALFLQKGQVDMNKVIPRETRASSGNAKTGAALYQNLCSTCHGLTGREIDDMPKMGALARKNPWETLHKTLYGHPGSDMPAYRDLGMNAALDILSYLQSLPD